MPQPPGVEEDLVCCDCECPFRDRITTRRRGSRTGKLEACAEQGVAQYTIDRFRHSILAFIIVLFCTVPLYCGSAQTQNSTEQSSATPIARQESPSPSPSSSPTPSNAAVSISTPLAPESKSTTPLTIEQIRGVLTSLAPADRFEFLRRQRKITLEAIDETSTQLKALSATVGLLQKQKETLSKETDTGWFGLFPSLNDADLERYKKDSVAAANAFAKADEALTAAKAKANVSQDELGRLENDVKKKQEARDKAEYTVQRITEDREKRRATADALKKINDELSRQSALQDRLTQSQLSYQRLLGEIDDMVNQLFIASDATNSFKLKMSTAFALLVGAVILGFFGILFSNDDVKKAIFSNESGIQFVTMFAIVIAVILFGIIGILESKELSALLGGLSGYILGKSKS